MIKLYLSIIILFSLLIACSDDGLDSNNGGNNSNNGGIEPTFSDIYAKIIEIRCATSGCHVSTHRDLDMSTKTVAYDNLIDVQSSQSLDYIEPGEPLNSYLYIKITDDSPPAGLRMPRTGPPYLSSSEISAIRVWIENGALDN